MRSLSLDLVCALRALRGVPLFTCVAAGTLSLGIALNVIVFSLVDSVLLESLAYPNPGNLVVLQSQSPRRRALQDLSAPTVFFVKQHATTLEDIGASYPTEAGVNITGMGGPGYAGALRVSADLFHTLGTPPMLGRTFDQLEDGAGAPVAVLSYSLWKRVMNDRSDLSGTLRINGQDYTVIGVMPESFRSYPEADLWLPLQLSRAQADPGGNYRVIARIRRGFRFQDAADELRKLSHYAPPSDLPSPEGSILVLQGLQRFESQDVRQRLLFLSSAVFLVLLITCANISMLLLMRTVGRSQEIGLRIALGSSRTRLIQVFLIEGVVVSMAGGLFGIILAKELLPLVLRMIPPGSGFARIHVNWHVVEFTCVISALTALLFGMATAISLSRTEMNELLGTPAFRVTAGASQTRAARFILVAQTSLTLMLLSGAILLLQHLLAVQKIQPGFDPQQAAVAQIALVGQPYGTAEGTTRVLERILVQLQALRSVDGVATISGLPFERGLNVPIHPEGATSSVESVEYRPISPNYFLTMRIPLTQGRQFAATNAPQAQHVAIINETMARTWWPASPATGHFITVGKELGPEFSDGRRLIVGVVADVHESSLEQPARPTVFVPTAQVSDSIIRYANQRFLTSIVIRTSEPRAVLQQVRTATESADPDLSVVSFRSLIEVVNNSTGRDRFYTALSATFGGFALLITAVGLYGLVSYQIGLRAREIAVRMSFGSNCSHMVLLMVRQSLRLTTLGMAVGAAGYVFSLRALAMFFHNLRVYMWSALGSGIALLTLVAIVATLVAALRIVAIEPAVLLRSE